MNRSDPHLGLLLERASRVVGDRLTASIGLDGVTSDHWRVLRHLADGAATDGRDRRAPAR